MVRRGRYVRVRRSSENIKCYVLGTEVNSQQVKRECLRSGGGWTIQTWAGEGLRGLRGESWVYVSKHQSESSVSELCLFKAAVIGQSEGRQVGL